MFDTRQDLIRAEAHRDQAVKEQAIADLHAAADDVLHVESMHPVVRGALEHAAVILRSAADQIGRV